MFELQKNCTLNMEVAQQKKLNNLKFSEEMIKKITKMFLLIEIFDIDIIWIE